MCIFGPVSFSFGTLIAGCGKKLKQCGCLGLELKQKEEKSTDAEELTRTHYDVSDMSDYHRMQENSYITR